MASKKPIPAVAKPKEAELEPTANENKALTETPVPDTVPEATQTPAELPKDYNEAHSIRLGDEIREIKSTKLKYQRNKTAVAYRILQSFPVPDVLAMEKGTFDETRDGDQILFDFLVAVFDDAEFVKRHYDDMTAADVERIVNIFCDVNGITDKEEAKNRAAKGTKG